MTNNPLERKPQRCSKRLDALGEALILERSEAVEKRRDKGREDQEHEDIESHPCNPHVEPPELAHRLHEPHHEKQKRDAEGGRQDCLLDEIRDKEPRRHAVEAKARLEHERPVDRERQSQRLRARRQRLRTATHHARCPAAQRPATTARRSSR